MAFVVDSARLGASASREILVLESQQAAPPSDALKHIVEPLLRLVEQYRDSIGAMHILTLCTRLLGISRHLKTKQFIIGFGLSALSQLLGDNPTDSQIQGCAHGITQLFTLLPLTAGIDNSCYCTELAQGLEKCSLVLLSPYLSDETRSIVIPLIEKLVFGSCGIESSGISKNAFYTLTKIYLALTNNAKLSVADVPEMLATIDDMNLLVRLLSVLYLKLDKSFLEVTLDKIMKGVFSTATPVYPETVISFAELLSRLKDSRVLELFGLILDMIFHKTRKNPGLSDTLNIETSDRALIRTTEKIEVCSNVLEYLVAYLSQKDAELREHLGLYILDSVMALLDTSENIEPVEDLQIVIYLKLLENAELIMSALYVDILYLWIESKIYNEVAQKQYWYIFSKLICPDLSDKNTLELSRLPQHLIDVLHIVARNLPIHMLPRVIKALDKDVVARFVFLGSVFLYNLHFSKHESLLKELLKCLDVIIHRCPVSVAFNMGDLILSCGLKQKDSEDASIPEALLFMMCAFYINFSSSHCQIIKTYAIIATEYISTSLFSAFHFSMDNLDISIKSLLVILIIALQYLPPSSFALLTGIRDTLISRWNKVIAMEGPIFNQTNYCLYMALLSILDYGKRNAEPSILILNTKLQEYSDLSLFQELPSMRYPQDLTEEGFNRYNDGENAAILTSFGQKLLIDDLDGDNAKIPAKHLLTVCFFGDSIALVLPIILRGLNDTTNAQEDIDKAMLSLHMLVFSLVKEALALFSQSLIPLPYKLAYRLDPYHNAMMPREYKSNEPRADDETYNLLLSTRIKIATLFVDDAGKTRLQAADTDWLALFKDGRSASRIIMHNFFDAFLMRAQQATASQYDRLFILNGLSFAHMLFEIDPDYLQSKRALVYNTLHQLLFKSSTLSPPHISYLVSCKTASPCLTTTFDDIILLIKQDTPQALAVKTYVQSNVVLSRLYLICVQLLELIAKEIAKFSPPNSFLNVLSFFLCKHHEEHIRIISMSILTLLLSEYINWNPGECPFEETIEGAAERLPIYEDGINIQQGNVRTWARDVLAAKSLFDRYESLDIKSPISQDALTLKKWLDASIWPAYSDVLRNTIDILGQDHDAQTFAERTNRQFDRQRNCMYILISEDIRLMLEEFLRKHQAAG